MHQHQDILDKIEELGKKVDELSKKIDLNSGVSKE